MQFRCYRFWLTLTPLFVMVLLVLFGLVFRYGYTTGQCSGYREGWFDRLLREDFPKTVVCSQYWIAMEDLCRSDLSKRKEEWNSKNILR